MKGKKCHCGTKKPKAAKHVKNHQARLAAYGKHHATKAKRA